MVPFIAGIAVGSVVVVVYNNSKEIKEGVNKAIGKAKEVAEASFEKTKEFTYDVKATVDEKIDCLKSKKKDSEQQELTTATS